jgi:hypothetical protein
MPPICTLLTGLIASLLVTAASCAAASVLDQVPRDALGVIVVRNLSEADAKGARLLSTLGVPLPGPLTLLDSFAGVGAGLDPARDLLIVLLPSENDVQPFHVALWLPVADYDALVRSLEGDPQRQIAAVTVAGEDLFVAQHGDWAVVMDPDQRGRLERMRNSAAAPSRRVVVWESWVAENDVALVALPAGMRTMSAWFAKHPPSEEQTAPPAAPVNDDLFGPPSDDASAAGFWPALRDSCRSLLADAPQLARWMVEARGGGCALKLDQAGNAVVSLRMVLPAEAVEPQESSPAEAAEVSPPRLFDGGEFVVVGSGRLAPRWSALAVAPYVHNLTSELATNFGTALNDDDVSKFRSAVERAVADVEGFAVLTRPGRGQDGVFTNNFLAVRVASDAAFIEHAAEAMRLWNKMIDREGAPMRLVFQSQPVTLAERPGTEYSIDMASVGMAAAFGVQLVPEFRQTVEKMFGPGGKFRLQFVAVDHETVLLAAATRKQAAQAVELLGRSRTEAGVTSSDNGQLRAAHELLAEHAAWRLYFSPHGYIHWLGRQMDAVLGPVIGGPVVRDLPASPPIGAVGGLTEQTAWVEVALPAETLQALSNYVRQ